MGYSLLDLLYPPHCFLCGIPLESHRFICNRCWEKLERVDYPLCERCGRPLKREGLCFRCSRGERHFYLARSWGYYRPRGYLARAIRGLKYRGERALASALAPLLLSKPTSELLPFAEAIAYVPQTKNKTIERGFNHARLLAEGLSTIVDLPVKDVLAKVRDTPPQARLGREERVTNLTRAFEVTRDPETNSILLIDDVYTTGATVDECSKVLGEAGVRKVLVVTLAVSP